MNTNIFLSAKHPYTNIVERKDLDQWLEPIITNAPTNDFTTVKINGTKLSGMYARFDNDSKFPWQKGLHQIFSYIKTTDTNIVSGKTYYTRSGIQGSYVYSPVPTPSRESLNTYYEKVLTFTKNGNAIDACLRGYRPSWSNKFCEITTRNTAIKIRRESNYIQIGSTNYYASSFRNSYVPYVICVIICGGGGWGGGGVLLDAGWGGGGAGCMTAVLDFSENQEFSILVGGEQKSSTITSGANTLIAGAGGVDTENYGGDSPSVGYYGNGLYIIGHAEGGNGGRGYSALDRQGEDGQTGYYWGNESSWSGGRTYLCSDSSILDYGNKGGKGSSNNGGGGGGSCFLGTGGNGRGQYTDGDNGSGYGSGGGGGGAGIAWIGGGDGGDGAGGIARFYY